MERMWQREQGIRAGALNPGIIYAVTHAGQELWWGVAGGSRRGAVPGRTRGGLVVARSRVREFLILSGQRSSYLQICHSSGEAGRAGHLRSARQFRHQLFLLLIRHRRRLIRWAS